MPHARFQLTEADAVAAAKADWRLAAVIEPIELRPGSVLVFPVTFVASTWLWHQLFHHHDQLQDAIADYVLAPLGLALFLLLLSWRDRKWTAIRRFHRDPAASAPRDIAWDETGLDIAPQGSASVPWTHFERWGEADGSMLLYTGKRDYLLLPASGFGPGDLSMMRAYLERAGVPEAARRWWRGVRSRASR